MKAFAEKVPRIEGFEHPPSAKRLCEFQQQHAKQEAFLDSTITGKKIVYAAPCDQKPKAKKPNPKATS